MSNELEIVAISTEITAIVNDAQFAEAGAMVKSLAALEAAINEREAPNIAKWHAGHKAAIATRDADLLPVANERKRIKALMGSFVAARQAQERIRAAQAAEALLKAQREAAEAAQTDDIVAQALAAEAVSVPVAAPAALPRTGVALRTYWHWEVTDAKLVPPQWCSPDPAKIGPVVQGLKDKCEIPGIRVWPETH